jgi:hypothetical protein
MRLNAVIIYTVFMQVIKSDVPVAIEIGPVLHRHADHQLSLSHSGEASSVLIECLTCQTMLLSIVKAEYYEQ